jgi:hypothetical protein
VVEAQAQPGQTEHPAQPLQAVPAQARRHQREDHQHHEADVDGAHHLAGDRAERRGDDLEAREAIATQNTARGSAA